MRLTTRDYIRRQCDWLDFLEEIINYEWKGP